MQVYNTNSQSYGFMKTCPVKTIYFHCAASTGQNMGYIIGGGEGGGGGGGGRRGGRGGQ